MESNGEKESGCFLAFYGSVPCHRGVFVFCLIIIASYFFLSSLHHLSLDTVACLAFHDQEFLWGTGFSHQIQLSKLQNDEEHDMKITFSKSPS